MTVRLPSEAAQWRAPDTAHPCRRVDWLEELADRGATDPVVRSFAEGASAELAAAGYLDPRARVLRMVQGLGRFEVLSPGDVYQTARATLERLSGDCKAWSVLLVACCRALGVPARMVWLGQPGEAFDHVTVQIRDAAGAWQWAEAAINGARLGEHPYAAAARLNREEVVR